MPFWWAANVGALNRSKDRNFSAVGSSGDVDFRNTVGGTAAYGASNKKRIWLGQTHGPNYTLVAVIRDSVGRDTTRNFFDADSLAIGSESRIWQFRVQSSNALYAEIFNSSGSNFNVTASVTTPSDRAIVVCARVSGTEITLWSEGALVGTGSLSGTAKAMTTADYVAVGNFCGYADQPFLGDIFGTWIVDGALSDAVLKSLRSPQDAWQLFTTPRRAVFPASSVGGSPFITLSNATYVPGSITSIGFRPRVTAS